MITTWVGKEFKKIFARVGARLHLKKPHENPNIGILICKSKDDEVIKYAMNRNMSSTMIAEYETKLINKKLLQEKLHEISLSLENLNDEE
jgi:YhcG PDDEXK nuclease domain